MKFHISTGSKKSRKKAGDSDFPVLLIGKIIAVVVVFFLVLVYKVSLNQQAEKLNRRANSIEKELEKVDREIVHLNMRKEKLSSWKFIAHRIRKHGLNLRIPKPYQVKSLIGTKNNFYRSKNKNKFEVSQR